jgi:hypothetical protein
LATQLAALEPEQLEALIAAGRAITVKQRDGESEGATVLELPERSSPRSQPAP